ncbi:MAG: hypothetical protein RIG84_19975 [Roseovarius sp.]
MTLRIPLSHTLTQLIEGVTPAHPGLAIEEAEIALPLRVELSHGPDGPLITAQPASSAYRSGFEPVMHRTRLRIETAAQPAPPAPLSEPDHGEESTTATPAWPKAPV